VDLTTDLKRVDTDLLAAKLEAARLRARIEGLQAEREALAAAMEPTATSADQVGPSRPRGTKASAILRVLAASEEPMRIAQIVEAMKGQGWPTENYNGISVYLDSMLKRKSVRRADRGLYTVAER
jgi:hypothetical protein